MNAMSSIEKLLLYHTVQVLGLYCCFLQVFVMYRKKSIEESVDLCQSDVRQACIVRRVFKNGGCACITYEITSVYYEFRGT